MNITPLAKQRLALASPYTLTAFCTSSSHPQARVWIAGGSSTSDETLWPIVVQDTFEEKVAAAAAEASVAVAKVNSTQAELDKLASDFSKYKARAHTALKKATSSGADEKRKDEV